MIVAMLSIFLFGIGTAQAVTGVADDVPGAGVVIPMICEGHTTAGGPVFGPLNTVWAIAERTALSGITCDVTDSVCAPQTPSASSIGVVRTNVFVNDRTSIVRLDSSACWSRNDVVSSDCQSLISQMSSANQAAMEVELGGVTYFAGYVEYIQAAACGPLDADRFIPWVYINDIVTGFASGMNGVSLEGGVGEQLQEICTFGSCDTIGVTARTVMPRIFILNSNADSFNWWMFLLGRNQYAFGPQAHLTRELNCFICNEGENCLSTDIEIPYELNIINVADEAPGSPVFPAGVFPKAGFAYCDINESGFLPGEATSTSIEGTLNFDSPYTYSLWGWSYQRAVPTSVNARVAAIHPIHRLYCQSDTNGYTAELPNRFDFGTVAECNISGPTP